MYNYFTEFDMAPKRTLIVKYEDKHELLSFENGTLKSRVLPHMKLETSQMNNDTGAGDSFAGGFIRGMLDNRLNADIAGPIALGVLAAKGRMISYDYENPYLKIQDLTNEFFDNMDC